MEIISLKLELMKPTETKKQMYQKMTELNTSFSNWLLSYEELSKATSKVYKLFSQEKLPSAVVNQTIREVKSKKKNQKAKTFRRFWCGFNNQNLAIEKENSLYKLSFPTLEKRIGVPVIAEVYQQHWLDKILSGQAKQGAAELYEKKGKWYISLSISFEPKRATSSSKVMGVDVGLNYLAVASVGTKTLFFRGNEAAFIRRTFSSRRKKLGKLKLLSIIKKSKNKESQWMKNLNHKMSRQIVNFAAENGVRCIRMEDLTGIRYKAKSKKEAGRNLHSWSHYQLQTFIEYKAKMAGIQVEYVNPHHTSQTCKCGHVDKKNRKRHMFSCVKCQYTLHSDANASINISKAISGLSKKKNKQAA
ncbi:RNA-guided endonuclease TnpB family protein [Domibacillus indicus]|uniref:RNA-guided endonuclease InsQ/TnpB family protein n=1 Tax=Domibacillus indicus TaxID=1437523 RepID=UPI00203FCC39|nr:RNA-guided endonuclease TnpB family protein [Domibacillus indicus]MCM3789359.1 RNA-guided endonuclease TnpB family protein [Domibacillus indicus]